MKSENLCVSHYEQYLKGYELQPIVLGRSKRSNAVEIGTKRRTEAGYVRIKTENGWIREHTLIMEEHIGRRLYPDEMVHHKNGIRDDNRIKNLELCTKFQPPGQRVSDQLEWAKEILARYGETFT